LERIGIIGDVHAEDETLEFALDFLQTRVPHLDVIVCTGDIVTGPGDAGHCCAMLRDASVWTVRGNHDRWFFAAGYNRLPHFTPDAEVTGEDRLWLASLPPTLRLHTVRGFLLLCHGLGSDDMAGVLPGDTGYALDANHRLHALVGAAEYRFVVNGHTHQRMVRTFDDLTILNGGTLRSDHQPCICVADFAAGHVQFYDLSDDDAGEDGPRIAPAQAHRLP
jgi:predicted phosphodiesterase